MISRRTFVVSWLGTSLLGSGATALAAAWARKPKVQAAPVIGGPRTLARQEWPPAITPEYVGIVDKGYACFADDMGRLAVVDLKREDNPQVMGELFGIGRKVVALAITQYRAFAVVQVESGAETIFQLVVVSLTPANDISIMSRTNLGNFAEPTCIASFGDVIAIGGSGLNSENQIVFYTAGKKKSVDPVQVSAIVVEHSPYKLDFQDRQLIVLCGAESTEMICISAANPRAPEALKPLRLDGSFPALARIKDQIMVAGLGFDKRYKANLVTIRPKPSIIASVPLPAVTEVLDLAAQKGQFLVLANQGPRQAVIPVIAGRKQSLTTGNPVLLPGGGRGSSPRAHIAVKDKDAYIATDWGGVQVLNVTKGGWQFSYSHTIPRLPASAIVIDAGANAVIACAELKHYNISDVHHPVLVESTEIPSSIRGMLSLGRTFLSLSKDALQIRSINKPSELIASAKATGTALAFDTSMGLAYVVGSSEKGAKLYEYKVGEDNIKPAGSFDITSSARKAVAQSGRLLLSGLNELNLYKIDPAGTPQLFGTRKTPNLAIRDVVFAGNGLIFISCVDENLKGSILALSADKEDLTILGGCDLPLDASALAVAPGGKAVVIGRGKGGKDMVALVNIADPAQMRIADSFPTIESASAIVVKDKTAIIAGRGLELIDIS